MLKHKYTVINTYIKKEDIKSTAELYTSRNQKRPPNPKLPEGINIKAKMNKIEKKKMKQSIGFMKRSTELTSPQLDKLRKKERRLK